MKIKEQIRSRREALGLSMAELAALVGVTETAVRHWESGRSFPGKSKMRAVENALGFVIDWHEGIPPQGEKPTAIAMMDEHDIELMMEISRLPKKFKDAIREMVQAHLAILDNLHGLKQHDGTNMNPSASAKNEPGTD